MAKKTSAAEKGTCFVIMPFGDPFDGYYEEILAPTIRKVELVPIRADEINKPGVIVNQIWHGIKQAELCVADVTGRNANVMYELGLAHEAGKPVVQIVQNVDDLPFDLRAYRHIVYETKTPRWATTLKRQLREMLVETIADPNSALVFPKSSYVGKFGAKSEKEATESALLITLGPDEATHEMKKLLVTSYRSCAKLDRNSTLDKIDAIIAGEVNRVTIEADDASVPDDERDFRRNMAKIVAGRIDNMQTEFHLLALQDPDKPVLECLAEAIDTWTPNANNGDDLEEEE